MEARKAILNDLLPLIKVSIIRHRLKKNKMVVFCHKLVDELLKTLPKDLYEPVTNYLLTTLNSPDYDLNVINLTLYSEKGVNSIDMTIIA